MTIVWTPSQAPCKIESCRHSNTDTWCFSETPLFVLLVIGFGLSRAVFESASQELLVNY